MRLIDADALLEQYGLKDATKYGNKDAKQQEKSYSTMYMYEIADMIEDAPTAYDVESVVDRLEGFLEEGFICSDCPYEHLEKCGSCCEAGAFKKAISIVRGKE